MTINSSHKKNRENAFVAIQQALGEFLSFASNKALLGEGDSLSLLKRICMSSNGCGLE